MSTISERVAFNIMARLIPSWIKQAVGKVQGYITLKLGYERQKNHQMIIAALQEAYLSAFH